MTAKELIEENKRTKVKYLDLGDCGLTELPKELFDCVWLEGLNLGQTNVELDFLESENKESQRKERKNPNKIIDINGLVKLKHLRFLYLENNNIEKIESLSHFEVLKTLNLSNNCIENADCLIGLQKLEILDLSNNYLQDISFINNLQSLERLDVSLNKLKDVFIKSINLKSLNLSFTDIRTIEVGRVFL